MEKLKKDMESLVQKMSSVLILLFLFIVSFIWFFPNDVKLIVFFLIPIALFYGIPASFTIDKIVRKTNLNKKREYAYYFLFGSIIILPIFGHIKPLYLIISVLVGGIVAMTFKFLNDVLKNKKDNHMILMVLSVAIWYLMKL